MVFAGCGTTGVEKKEINIQAVNIEQEKMIKEIRHEEVNEDKYKAYIYKYLEEEGGPNDEN